MAQSMQTESRIRTAISIKIDPIKLSSGKGKEKDYKESITKEIVITINALLNSGGGTLELFYESTPIRKKIDACVRIIEQKIGDSLDAVDFVSIIEFERRPQKIFINVKEVEGPFIVNYNLYLPTKSQVKVIPPSVSVAKVKAMLNRRDKPAKAACTPGLAHQDFVKNEITTCDEDINVQWKSLKSECTRNITLADRITSKANKFSCYVSAFANYCGGHIYYGINDDGLLEGEKVTDKDKNEIIKKVTSTIEKMIWPWYCKGGPKRGQQWDIFFVPVKDGEGKPVASTFVIVVAIAFCRGGVFTDKPESYQIVDGKVEEMEVTDWQKYFCETADSLPGPVSSKMLRPTWSSMKNRQIYQFLTTKLVQFRNDREINKFTGLCDMAMAKYPKSCAALVATAEKAAIACKNNQFKIARSLLDEYNVTLHGANVNDVLFFEVRGLCLRSRTERAEGKCIESYETAKDGLQKMQLVPADFLTVWFYIHAAAVATILSTKERNPLRYSTLVNECQNFLEAALRIANTLDEKKFPRSTADLKQKSRIYLAMSLLGSSITGEIVKNRNVTKVDIENAASELTAVQGSRLDGIQPTHFQEVEYFLAQSDLCYRRSIMSPCSVDQVKQLRWAFELSKKAHCLAQELHFEEAAQYANTRLARLTEMLVRNTLQSCSRRRLENELEDLLTFTEEC